MTNEPPQTENNNVLDWVVKTPKFYGRKARLERVGAVWGRPKDDGICVRLHGTQVIADDIYLFPVESDQQ